MTTPKATLAALRKHALTYPEATEEFPWGDRTITAALLAELTDWIDESYRAIAPKTLVKALDARAARRPARR